MAKEACDQFEVEGKTTFQSANREEVSWCYAGEEMQGHRDNDHCTRTSSPKKEDQHLKKTYNDDISRCIWQKTIVSPSLHKYITAPRIIKSSSICTLFQYRWHKMGFVITAPVQPPVATFPPSQTMCDSLSHMVDPNSLVKIVCFSFY